MSAPTGSAAGDPAPAAAPTRPPVQQPKPRALAKPASGGAILVSPRQRGNPVLNHIHGLPWEYADTPADYVLGATTCALFLSLKYHKLHPEYVFGRITGLQGRYDLRILLVLVDIDAHEEPLRLLSKTSLVNGVTIILCWSAQEAGRYLELFKTYEHAAPTLIKGHQSTDYVDRLVGFVTVPRGVNKTDAISLVTNFGSVRTAVNAQPEDLSLIAGWGEKKVQRWYSAVHEPFRSEKAAKKVLSVRDSAGPATRPPAARKQKEAEAEDEDDEDEAFAAPQGLTMTGRKRSPSPEGSDGVMAALARMRNQG
jgi:DNA excision repair protein ERCC-1